MCRKTQWEVPRWDSSPSSEEEHTYNAPEPDHTSIPVHSYTDMEEVIVPSDGLTAGMNHITSLIFSLPAAINFLLYKLE